MSKSTILAAGALAWALLAACEPDDWSPDRLRAGQSSAVVLQLKKGQAVYANYCAGCHGENGDGNGVAAKFLNPKPRDFKLGRLKFAYVAAGQAPRDEDYLRIIDGGLMGTAMPSFRLLPTDEKRDLVAYLKTFYTEWADDPPGSTIALAADPFLGKVAEGIEVGRRTYHSVALCYSCHPGYELRADIAKIYQERGEEAPELRTNLYEGEVKESTWGDPIRAPNFLEARVKNGLELSVLAHVIASGVGGTAMPTWAGALDPENPENEARMLWGLAYYVRDLALKRATPAGRALQAKLRAQPAPAAPAEAPAAGDQPGEKPAEK